MSSSVYGHPGMLKDARYDLPTLKGIEAAKFALSFEDDGLRAKVILVDSEH